MDSSEEKKYSSQEEESASQGGRIEIGDLYTSGGKVVAFDEIPHGALLELPLLELRNNVLFPETLLPVMVGRERSKLLLRDLDPAKPLIAVVAQRDEEVQDPKAKDLYRLGVLAEVQFPDEEHQPGAPLMLRGVCRFKIKRFVSVEPYFRVLGELVGDYADFSGQAEREEEFRQSLLRLYDLWVIFTARVGKMKTMMSGWDNALAMLPHYRFFVNMLAVHLELPVDAKQSLLKYQYPDRVGALHFILEREIAALNIRKDLQEKASSQIEAQQREYILRQQLNLIQQELGEDDPDANELAKLKAKAKKLKWNKDTQVVFDRELERLGRMNSMAPDYSIQLSYLEFLTDLPWGKFSTDNYDLTRAEEILNEDHFGIEQVKERILEYLAVLKLKNDLKAPILCLWGPPGVGKTSLGKSVARALGRKYARISLGGVDDEGEIRGHRRTYIGAMPGRILQNIRKVKTSNPVFILDEIDKLSSSRMGDPASALLEVLDPEQNTSFSDNYLEVDYDLSHVLFITTANDISQIPVALRDRMELIELTGYLLEEKVSIGQRFLIPKQLQAHGVKRSQFSISDELLASVIKHYTQESGVRKLDQVIAKLIRQQARKIANGEEFSKELTPEDVRVRLGIETYSEEAYSGETPVGVAIGMAWTSVGGDILYVESSLSEGKGTLSMTGNLGEVMKESTEIALQVIRARAVAWGIDPQVFSKTDVHVHVPEGAIPKDGPSAGVTMVTSMLSSFTRRKPLPGVAMTGEITLRGKVLPVGGIKEKILAAKRANIGSIILPSENRKDIEEIKQDYIQGLKFTYIDTVDQLLEAALGEVE